MDRKENKQRNFAESETKQLVRSHNKNAENVIFRTRDEGTSILGEIYNAGNNCSSKEERAAPYEVQGRHQKCNWTFRLKSVSERKEKVEFISEQHSQEEKTDQYLIQAEGNGNLVQP